ncbi:MAG: hypothetical protein JNG89_19000 [Planctomycetaceae bacterium]|nr:hypothetical protein [Planctomycetaceae bacterium]
MAELRTRRLVRRATASLAILIVVYLLGALSFRGAVAAGWLPEWAVRSPTVTSIDDPLVWYIKSNQPGSGALKWLVIQSEIAGTRFHPSQQ